MLTVTLLLIFTKLHSQTASYHCAGTYDSVYLKAEVPADPAGAGYLQTYLDTAFSSVKPAPVGLFRFSLLINKVGTVCCLGISGDNVPWTDTKSMRPIVEKMPTWRGAIEKGRHVSSYASWTINFEKGRAIPGPADVGASAMFGNFLRRGDIRFKNGRSLSGLIRILNAFGPYLFVRPDTGQALHVAVNEIQSLSTETNTYENVQFADGTRIREVLMWRMEQGAITLYSETRSLFHRVPIPPEKRKPGSNVTERAVVSALTTYVLKKAGSNYVIDDLRFRDQLFELMGDDKTVAKMINSKTFRLEQIGVVVNRYNVRKKAAGINEHLANAAHAFRNFLRLIYEH